MGQPAQAKPASAVADQPATPTASALFGNKPEQSGGEVFDFNRNENPLRGAFDNPEAKPAVGAEAKPDGNGSKPAGQENFEDELETPAFLKRRRNLFE